jgi:16S rRNA (uracil1498-N3)-methyltransferase
VTPPRFLAPTETLSADEVTLTGPEGHHAVAVRRVRVGESVDLTDGRGLVAHAVVRSVARDSLVAEVLSRSAVAAPDPRFVVVQALAKGGRDEDAVEAMTEVGVDEIVPWAAARCVARWKDRTGEKWAATVREASKQARRAWIPTVAPLASTTDVAARVSGAGLGVVLHEAASAPLASLPVPPHGEVVVVVGPEGGLTDEELGELAAAGARVCRLGASVLRSSTAGVAALAVLSASARWR